MSQGQKSDSRKSHTETEAKPRHAWAFLSNDADRTFVTECDIELVWTPRMVADQLVEACRWVVYTAGQTGPSGIKGQTIPFLASAEDFEAEGWGAIEDADADEPVRDRRASFAPSKVSALEATLYWPATYLATLPGPATVLKVWLRCKVYRLSFDKVARHRSWSRATAYRARDRALATIALGLMRDRVRPGER